MKKSKKRGLALFMAVTLSVGSGFLPMNDAKAGETESRKKTESQNEAESQQNKEVKYDYKKLDQEPMKASATASSEQDPMSYNDGGAELAFDGDPYTAWHSSYDIKEAPHWIQWELGGSYPVGRISYTRKADGVNGTWKSVVVALKTGDTDDTWVEVYSGDLDETAKGDTVNIDFSPVTASAVNVTVNDSYNMEAGSKFASAGEINVYEAVEKAPELEKPIRIDPSELELNEGETFQLGYILTPEAEAAGGTVKWNVRTGDIINMDENGFVTAVGEGSDSVTVNYKVGNVTYSSSCKITVKRVDVDTVISVNGTDYQVHSLEEALAQAGTAEDISAIEYKSGVLRGEDLDYIQDNEDLFDYELKSFIVGDDVKLVGLQNSAIPSKAFYLNGTSGIQLQTVYLGKGVKGIEGAAFDQCRAITSFEAPYVEYIRGGALSRIKDVPVYSFPMLKELEENTFGKMSVNTEELYIPSVEKIDYNVLSKFGSLKKLTLGSVPPVVTSLGNPTDKALVLAEGVAENLELVIPEDAADAYRADAGYETETNTWCGIKLPEVQTEAAVTVNVNGTGTEGASLEEAAGKIGVAAGQITSVEFISGTATEADLAYVKNNLKNIETFVLNLGENMKYQTSAGEASTVLPESAFTELQKLATVELKGFTEIGSKAFQYTHKLENVSIPDAQIIGSYAFRQRSVYGGNQSGMAMKSIDLPNVTEIKRQAFDTCKGLTSVNMPVVRIIGASAFVGANSLTEIVLPETIEEIGSYAFDRRSGSGDKTVHVTINRAVPPSIDANNTLNLPFAGADEESTLTVPDGAQDAYVSDQWGNAENGTWANLKINGLEQVLVTVNVNGAMIGAASLEKAVAESGMAAEDVLSLEFVSGNVTQEDLAYIKELAGLETFTLNINDSLQVAGKDGNPTTVLSPDTAVIEFAEKKSGSSKAEIRTIVLGGFTEIQNNGLKSYSSAECIRMPDVITVGDNAFANASWLEELYLNSAETIGKQAFLYCQRLTKLELDSVKVLGESSFKYTDALKNLTLPETITTVENIEFGKVRSGNKNGTKLIIRAAVPPTVAGGAFNGVASSGSRVSTVTVPQGSLAAYVAQIDSGADTTKVLKRKQTIWNNLYIREEGSYLIEYNAADGSTYNTQYAFVKAGDTITADKLPETSGENVGDNMVLEGWNTKKDGSGIFLTAETIPTEDMKVYAIFKEEVSLEAGVTYSNSGKPTNQDVTVTLTANKPIQDIEGWTRVSESVLEKTYGRDGSYEVTVTDSDGNTVTVSVEVSGIDKAVPSIKVSGEGSDPYYRTISSIAVHDTVGLASITVNGVKTELGDKYYYLTRVDGLAEGKNEIVVADQAGNTKEIVIYYDTTAPTFEFVVDNSQLEASKTAQLVVSEEIIVPDEGWVLISSEEGRAVYEKTFTANWKDKAFTVTDLAGNVSDAQFVEVKRVDNAKPTAEITQDITDWTNKDVTVTIKTSTDCQTPEGWTKVNKRTFTKVFKENGSYSVRLVSATGITGDEQLFEITNIDREAPVIQYDLIADAKGYSRTIELNDGDEYTNDELVEMFTEPTWVTDNSGTAKFSVDTWGLKNGLDGYDPFTSKEEGTYKVRFYAYDAAGNHAAFDVYVKVEAKEPDTDEELTTTINYTVFIDNEDGSTDVLQDTYIYRGPETGDMTFDLSMIDYLPDQYELADGETGYRILKYGETTAFTFIINRK